MNNFCSGNINRGVELRYSACNIIKIKKGEGKWHGSGDGGIMEKRYN